MVHHQRTGDDFSTIVGRIRPIVDYVIAHSDKFQVDSAIHGDLLQSYEALRAELVRYGAAAGPG